jgi:hypothetical protein
MLNKTTNRGTLSARPLANAAGVYGINVLCATTGKKFVAFEA